MITNHKLLRRSAAAFTALAFVVAAALPAWSGTYASADQLINRSLKMSDSTPGVTTNLQYILTFTTGNVSAQSIIVDFCSDTPLIGSTCAFNAGVTVPTLAATPTIIGGGTVSSANGRTLKVTGLTIGANATYSLTINGGITNPSALGTFYARIITYAGTNANNYVPATLTGDPTTTSTYVDYGGVALSTAQQVNITTRVMESLSFCASKVNIDGTAGASFDDCSEATPPTLDIGHGTPKVLESGTVDSDMAYTQLSTNASSGAIVRMKATNTCANGGLSKDGGATCNIGGTTDLTYVNGEGPIVFVANTAAFGLFVSDSRTTTGIAASQGTVTADPNYNDGINENEAAPTTVHYGMDNRNTTEGVNSTYGDPIASSAGPVNKVNNDLLFAATPSLTTPAGIYTANEILIATGTF